MHSSNRRRAVLLTAAVAAVLAVAAVTAIVVRSGGSHTSPPGPTVTVANVDGIAIPTREFALYLEQDRAAVFAYFQQNFGTQDSKGFWTTRFGGQTPTARLRSAALSDAAHTTVEFALAFKYKLVRSPAYAAFLSAWSAENQRRRSAIANQQPIYGPQQYTEANYLTYVLGNLGPELQDKLVADGTFDPSDANLQAYYLKHVGDFSGGRVGPMPARFDFAKEQVRLAYLNAQYTTLTNRLANSATVSTTQHMRQLIESGCISAGGCSSAHTASVGT